MIDTACVARRRVVFDMSVVGQNSSKLAMGVAGASKLPFPFPTSDSVSMDDIGIMQLILSIMAGPRAGPSCNHRERAAQRADAGSSAGCSACCVYSTVSTLFFFLQMLVFSEDTYIYVDAPYVPVRVRVCV